MFKKTTVQALLPEGRELEALDVTRLRALTSNEEAYNVYDDLCIDLQLRSSQGYVPFDGCEQTVYCGRSDDKLVFAIYIGDDEPGWLTAIVELSEEEIPVHGESVYIIAPGDAGREVDAQLAVYGGDSATWDCEKMPPLRDDELARLIELVSV